MRAGEKISQQVLSPFFLLELWRKDRPAIEEVNGDYTGVIGAISHELKEAETAWAQLNWSDELSRNMLASEIADVIAVTYNIIQSCHEQFVLRRLSSTPESTMLAHLRKSQDESQKKDALARLSEVAEDLATQCALVDWWDYMKKIKLIVSQLNDVEFLQENKNILLDHSTHIIALAVGLLESLGFDVRDVLRSKVAYNNIQYPATWAKTQATYLKKEGKTFADERTLREEFFGPIPQGTNPASVEEVATPILAVAR